MWDGGFCWGLGREKGGRRKWEGRRADFDVVSFRDFWAGLRTRVIIVFVDGGGIWVVGKESLEIVTRYVRMNGRSGVCE